MNLRAPSERWSDLTTSRFLLPASPRGRAASPGNASAALRCRPATPHHAFTLVEVLVALVIFAMAAVVLGSSYLNVLISYETVSRGVQVNEDFAFARELVLREPDRKKLEQGGEFETVNGRRANWSVEITSTTVPNVFTVTFTCETSDPGRTEPQKLTQQFTVLRPTWVIDTAERDQLKADIKTRIYELQGKKA